MAEVVDYLECSKKTSLSRSEVNFDWFILGFFVCVFHDGIGTVAFSPSNRQANRLQQNSFSVGPSCCFYVWFVSVYRML